MQGDFHQNVRDENGNIPIDSDVDNAAMLMINPSIMEIRTNPSANNKSILNFESDP